MSLLFALVVSAIFYQMVGGASSRKPPSVEKRDVVVAARPLQVGQTIGGGDISLVKVPAGQFPKDAFGKPDEVVGRPVVSPILADEPVREGRLAARGTGSGLAPIIPVGMRAVAVRVNDVVGVAGFVLPGMRVDVLVTGKPPNREGTVTNTVLQNIVVLSAGQTIEPDARGKAINAPVVTVLVSPEQAEILTLAGNEGRIQLVLRNGGDQELQKTAGREVAELYGARPRPRAASVVRPPPPVIAPPTAPPPKTRDEIVVLRGNQRTVEVVGIAGSQESGQ
jgi:pilus assembly protein CpaB